jgi:xylulokinase
MPPEHVFLGIDCSTQALKATAVTSDFRVLAEDTVNYDADLPEFGTKGGAHRDGLRVTTPPMVWVASLDLLFERMKSDGFPFGRVAAVSGSGQQHGSVFLRKGARGRLGGLAPIAPMRDQLKDVFSVPDSPIWMDSSTAAQCRKRDAALGGAQAVAALTGSRSYERFTGNQIAKIYEDHPRAYEETERICLVSSFVASLLIGDCAPVDASDGSGMNLMDLREKRWDPSALAVTAPGLEARLGPITASHAAVGTVSRYFLERYGFSGSCHVIAFSGDNPNSLAGLRLSQPGDIAVSLGTSDTVFGSLREPKPSAEEGHIFVNPVDPEGYMALICYKNGSLTRERIRDGHAGGSWKLFSEALKRTPAGNGGNIGFYFLEPEITPPVTATGISRFDGHGRVADFPDDVEVRAVVEGQFLSMRLHGERVGIRPRSVLATGGASANREIAQVLADVFGVPVWTGDQPNSASLGAAYRALHGWRCRQEGRFISFSEAMEGASSFRRGAEPDRKAGEIYREMEKRYGALEKRVMAERRELVSGSGAEKKRNEKGGRTR